MPLFALRDFRYLNHQTREVVDVAQGQQIDVQALTASQTDVEKLVRTKYAGEEVERPRQVAVTPKRKRGRPRKVQ